DYVAVLEDVLREAAERFGVAAERRAGHPGLWVGESKLASIGIEVHRGVTLHGFALNVDMDLAGFSAIVPCGVPGLRTIDLSRACGAPVSIAAAAAAVVAAWRNRFGDIEEEESNERGG
ncbi:MAG: lipoyl protein ligase domain-containing protein, partial [Candidatus Binatia bacterium]